MTNTIGLAFNYQYLRANQGQNLVETLINLEALIDSEPKIESKYKLCRTLLDCVKGEFATESND